MGGCVSRLDRDPKLPRPHEDLEEPAIDNAIMKTFSHLEPSSADLADSFCRIHTPEHRKERIEKMRYEMCGYWIIDEQNHRNHVHLRSFIYKKLEGVPLGGSNTGDVPEQLKAMQTILEEQMSVKIDLQKVDLSKLKWFTQTQPLRLLVMELTKRPNPAVMWKYRLLFSSLLNLMKSDNSSQVTSAFKLCVMRKEEITQMQRSIGKTIEILEFLELSVDPPPKAQPRPADVDQSWVEVRVTFPVVDLESEIYAHEGYYVYLNQIFIKVLNYFTVKSVTRESKPFDRWVVELDYGLRAAKEGVFSDLLLSHHGSINTLRRSISDSSQDPLVVSAIKKPPSLIRQRSNEDALVYFLHRQEQFEEAGDLSEIISMIGSKIGQGSKFNSQIKGVDEFMKEYEYQKAQQLLKKQQAELQKGVLSNKLAEVWYLIGLCLQKMERFKEAITYHEKAKEFATVYPNKVSKKSNLLYKCSYAACLSNIISPNTTVKDQQSNMQKAAYIMAECWAQLGALKAEPRSYCECVRMIAQYFIRIKNLDQGKEDIIKMVGDAASIYRMVFNPKQEAAALVLLAQVLYSFGKRQQANQVCNRALNLISKAFGSLEGKIECLSQLYAFVGDINQDNKQYSEAIDYYNKAINAKPQKFRVEGKIVETCTEKLHLNIGDCYLKQASLMKEAAQKRAAAGSASAEPKNIITSIVQKAIQQISVAMIQEGEKRFPLVAEQKLQIAQKLRDELEDD